MKKLIEFLNDLEARAIHYRLAKYSDYAVMVEIAVPGERWEVEFCEDGRVVLERFCSNGEIHDEAALLALIDEYTD